MRQVCELVASSATCAHPICSKWNNLSIQADLVPGILFGTSARMAAISSAHIPKATNASKVRDGEAN